MLFDQNLRAFETESLGQTDRLAAAMLKDLGGCHIYSLYLHQVAVKSRVQLFLPLQLIAKGLSQDSEVLNGDESE